MTLTLTPVQIQRSNRAQWIERALDGIERFSNSSLTTDQKNAISVQFGVLMDQLDVAVETLKYIQAFDPEKDTITEKTFDEWGEAESFRMCRAKANAALEQLKSSKFSI